jgi:hypothetical protein
VDATRSSQAQPRVFGAEQSDLVVAEYRSLTTEISGYDSQTLQLRWPRAEAVRDVEGEAPMRGLSEPCVSLRPTHATTCDTPGSRAGNSAASPLTAPLVCSRTADSGQRRPVSDREARPYVAWGANVAVARRGPGLSAGQDAPLCERMRRSDPCRSDAGATFCSPAMEASVSDHVWSTDEIVALLGCEIGLVSGVVVVPLSRILADVDGTELPERGIQDFPASNRRCIGRRPAPCHGRLRLL